MSVTPVNVQIPGDTAAPVIADFVEHALRVAYIERAHLASLPADEWDAPGVYVLITGDGSGRVYIGQGRKIRARLIQHASNERLPWRRAMAVKRDTTHGFNTAEIGYLEGRVAAEIGAIEGLTVVAGQGSGDETLPAHMRISLDAFVLSILTALRLAGVDITRAEADIEGEEETPLLTASRGARSRSDVKVADLVSSGLLRAGEELLLKQGVVQATGTVTSNGEIIVRGVTYKSPSAAARNALGLQSSNGWTTWHVGGLDGDTLYDLRNKWLDQKESLTI